MKLKSFTTALLLAILSACASQPQLTSTKPSAQQTVKPVKNIILMIGDGMGPQQLGLLQSFAKHAKSSPYANQKSAIEQFAESGRVSLSMTNPVDHLVVDSACSATQLALGQASNSEMIGLDAQGHPQQTILELAKSKGLRTGLVSDTRLTHATPASFAAHQAHRSMENQIAQDMLAQNDVDVMLSGGLRHFLPKSAQSLPPALLEAGLPLKSKRKDNQNLLHQAAQQGYQLAFNQNQLANIQQGRTLGLFASSGMQDGIASHNTPNQEPTLAEMTQKALSLLSQNDQGFFLMIEGGQIDWAAHNNDAGTMLHELLKFDQAINTVYQWAKDRDDTLVVITADHETGGFGFSYSANQIPQPSDLPGSAFDDKPFAPNFNFGEFALLDQLYQQSASFESIWSQAKGEARFPSPERFTDTVNQHSQFTINQHQSKQILQRQSNPYYKADHKYLSDKDYAVVPYTQAFFVYGQATHLNLLGHTLGTAQNIVWSTGTHTNTPVPVVVWGPKQQTQAFDKVLHHAELGELMQRIWL